MSLDLDIGLGRPKVNFYLSTREPLRKGMSPSYFAGEVVYLVFNTQYIALG